jgi:putative ABC transport system permease protein
LNQRFPRNGVQVESVADTIAPWFEAPRLLAIVFGGFGICSAVLVSIGLYAIARLSVTRRAKDLQIRLALGATPARLRRSVVSSVLKPMVIGVGMGLLVLIWTGGAWRFLGGTGDLVQLRTCLLAVFAVVSISVVAAWIPTAGLKNIYPAGAFRDQ